MHLPTKPFLRSAKRLAGKNPVAAEDLRTTLELLAEDAFDPRLKANKLRACLKNRKAWMEVGIRPTAAPGPGEKVLVNDLT